MVRRRSGALLAAATLTCAGLVGAAGPAAAAPPPAETPATVTVLTEGLSGPRQLSATSRYVYVAESDSGEITRVAKSTGKQKLQVNGIETPQGVVRTDGRFFVASGEPEPEPGTTIPKSAATLLVAKTNRKPKVFANLLKYELTYNPDNQTQFGPDGTPPDAIANPYYVVRSRSKGGYLLVANAGGNDIIAVSKKGAMSTFFVPPSVTSGPCAEATDQNSDAGPSCDAVPTGMAYGPDGNLYISALTGFAPGEGRVYVVDKNGKLVTTLTGFSGPTGVAVGPDGSVYVSELLQGADLGEPEQAAKALSSRRMAKAEEDEPDPTPVGQIVKVPTTGARTYAQVTMPSGLLWNDGRLWASAWSLIPDAGQIVAVDPVSFLPA